MSLIVHHIKWKRAKPKLTGVSVPVLGGGLSWSPKAQEKQVVRGLVIQLQERRALFAQIEQEDELHLNVSIRDIRGWLSETLKELADGSEAYRLTEHLRAACNTYLAVVRDPIDGAKLRPHVQVALQALRESFRVTLEYIGQHGDLPQAIDLARKIPHEVRMEAPVGKPVREINIVPKEIPQPGRERPDPQQK